MASPTPLFTDMVYHIYNRGINRENIFLEERNYDYFWGLYLKYVDPVVDTYAYCLLRNHFHILIKVKTEDAIRPILEAAKRENIIYTISRGFADFFNAYAKAINKAYGRTGGLFLRPFGRVAVTNDKHFWAAVTYIHQNPQRHGLVADFREWKWSSYGVILSDAPTRLRRQTVLDWFGGRDGYVAGHAQRIADWEWFAGEDGD